jgi:hypothetical protein
MSETVYVLQEPKKDRWGDVIPGTDEQIEVKGVKIWPRKSDETDDNTLIVGYTAFFPAKAKRVPTAAEEVLWRGTRYEVEGKPGLWVKDGRLKGTEVALQEVTG